MEAAQIAYNGLPKVSIIIIFFNAERFMEETIQSVLSQTFKDWELLLVDDGSSDSSPVLAKQYAGNYPGKIHYIQHRDHKNHGMSATRNLGLSQARGEYIAFIDADDVWVQTNLERQVQLLDSHPDVEMVYGNTIRWYSWTGVPGDIELDQIKKFGVTPNTAFEPPNLMTLYLKTGAFVPCMCSIMVRKKALVKENGFESGFKGLYEDQVFYAKMALNYRIYIDEEVSSKYRQHPWSACYQAEKNGDYDPPNPGKSELVYLKWLRKYIRKKRIHDPSLHAALWTKLNRYDITLWRRLKAKWKVVRWI